MRVSLLDVDDRCRRDDLRSNTSGENCFSPSLVGSEGGGAEVVLYLKNVNDATTTTYRGGAE
jgi:hypothetical protein